MADTARPTVVSLDYCADQFVIALADADQVLALSKDAQKPFSHQRDAAAAFPQVRAAAEDVIALHPDLVVRSYGGDVRALAFYDRIGIQTVQMGFASDIAGVEGIIRDVASALGQTQKGEALIASMPAPAAPSGKRALYVTQGGVTGGTGTMMDALLNAAGVDNAASGMGWLPLPLEELVQEPPALAVTAFFGFDADAQNHWSLTRHPVMARILAQAQTYPLDETRLTCPTWFVAEEAADLAAEMAIDLAAASGN